MAIRFICPHCGHQIYVADDLDGRQGQCPKCGRFAMIQGQHIPDSNVPNLVNIATAPENRPVPAGPAEKTIVMARGTATVPAAPSRAAAPAPAFPPPLPAAPMPGSSRGIAPMGNPLAAAAAAAASLRPRSATGARPVVAPEEPAEEDEGVGMQKLVLSIVAGAAAAAIIGILLFLAFGPKKTTVGPSDGTAVADKDHKGGTREWNGPIYNIWTEKSVAVIVNVPGTAADHLDHVQKELATFADLVADAKIPVTHYVVVYPTPPGDPRDAKSGTALTAQDFQRWLDQVVHNHRGGDLTAAVQYAVEQSPDVLILISLNPLGAAQARVKSVLQSRPNIVVHGVALGSEAAKADLEQILQAGGRFRYQTLSAR
jgi:hypothetical protein